IERILRTAGGFRLRLSSGGHTEVAAVLIAAPPPTARRLTDAIDKDLAAMCGRIRMASVVTVALGFSRAAVRHPLNGIGLIVPIRERLHVRAISWMSSKWAGRAPGDQVLLRAVLGGALDARAIEVDDDRLIAYAVRDAAKLLGIRGDPVLERVY